MGLGQSGVQLYLELWRKGILKEVRAVIDIGSQELHITVNDFKELLKMYGMPGYRKEKFLNLENWPAQPRCSTKPFYELLGAKEYACIDLNKEHGAIPHDLNMPLENRSLFGRYDLVTDYGCNEHIFNTSEAYRTMHRLCKSEGIMVIMQTWYNGNGYYNYDPSFFEGMAAANGYNVLFTSSRISLNDGNQYHLPLSNNLLNIMDRSKLFSMGMCYVLQKTSGDDFRIPYQGQYLAQSQGAVAFQTEVHFDPPRRTYVPMYTNDFGNVSGRVLLRILGERIVNKIKRSIR